MKSSFVGVGVAVIVAFACGYACDSSPESHVYVAALYYPATDCFGPSESLAYIDTPDGDLDCAPTCIVLHTPSNGGPDEVYVSTMCGPYPQNYDISQTDTECAAALAAWPAEQTALANGSNSCASPSASEDAGEDVAEDSASNAEAAPPDDGSGAADGADDGGGAVNAADGGG